MFFQFKYLSERLITSAQNVVPVHVRTPSVAVYTTLADSRVNDSLLQIIPHFYDALLQLVNVTYTTFIYSLMHDSPDIVVDGVQIWTVWRPEVRTDEVGCRLMQ